MFVLGMSACTDDDDAQPTSPDTVPTTGTTD